LERVQILESLKDLKGLKKRVQILETLLQDYYLDNHYLKEINKIEIIREQQKKWNFIKIPNFYFQVDFLNDFITYFIQ